MAGYSLGDLTIKKSVDGETVSSSELLFPEGFSLVEPWAGATIQAGNYAANKTTLTLIANDPQVQAAIAAQPRAEAGYVAVTINYRTSDGTLVKTESFRSAVRPAAGGLGQSAFLNQNYQINVPEGYTLVSAIPSQIFTPNIRGRGMAELTVSPDTHPSETVTNVHCDFYSPEGELLWIQDIPFYGEGEVRLTQNMLQLPPGYVLDEIWTDYVTQAGQDLTVRLQIIPRQDGTGNRQKTLRVKGTDTAASSSMVLALTGLAASGTLGLLLKRKFWQKE